MDLFAKRSPVKTERTREIKATVAARLSLGEDATVMVTELNCQDDDCPEVETVIAIFRPAVEKIQKTFHCAIDEITDDEIERFCRNLQDKLPEVTAPVGAVEENNNGI
jgi:hypothetical protein